MRFSITSTIVAVSSLACLSSRLVSAKLTPQERAAFELTAGPNPNYCQPCLTKAMHNHFPHACTADMDSNEANSRPSGATSEEERCVCLAFQDLFWMKADCSLECPYVHNNKTMQYFLPASKIEGCDKWLDFDTGKEKEVEGFPPKNPDHQPAVYEIAPAPETTEGEDDPTDVGEDGRYKVSVSITTEESDARDKERAELLKEQKKQAELDDEQQQERRKQKENAKSDEKDEL
ncbi:hypothetical protein EDD11_002083 [Mortierella claussenii]|nr:hypothetical protein EDD11_002083 [Mortierella claussenii]